MVTTLAYVRCGTLEEISHFLEEEKFQMNSSLVYNEDVA